MTDPDIILDIQNLLVARPAGAAGPPILDHVNFALRRGDFLAIVGESGSGKTTLAHAIIGLLAEGVTVKSGQIRFGYTDLLTVPDHRLTRIRGAEIGFVPQDPATSLNPVKTIGAQLSEVFRLRARSWGGTNKARCIALLEQVGIDQPERRLKQYPHQLSGGQKQRVLIAIGFALNPRLLIADEPTSALDVTVQKQVMTVFDRLVAEHGTTVVFVTHNIALAADHASRILVMRGGKIVEGNDLAGILARPVDPYTRLLLESARSDSRPTPRRAVSDGAIIEVESLVKVFDAKARLTRSHPPLTAVDHVSFAVRPGSTFGIVGESGSGKSTTARMIIGLESPTAGHVRFNGQDITRLPRAEQRAVWRDIQLVHQNPYASLNPRAKIGEIIASPLRAHGIGSAVFRAERAASLLEQVGLPRSLLARRPRELSGGQRQRVAIARALALNAKIIILDEALSALDVVTQAQVLDLLRALQEELGLTYIFISHDLTVVKQFADDIAVMHRGRLVEIGPVAEIFERPATPYTRSLLGALPGQRLAEAVFAITA